MRNVVSLRGLMIDCVQDLREGEAITLKRLPSVVDGLVDGCASDILTRRLTCARRREADLEATAAELAVSSCGPQNIWMSGMLDDAQRDIETVEPGPLLDIALVGAVRKMVTASLVSYETAAAVADRLGLAAAGRRAVRARDEEAEADAGLQAALRRLAAACVAP